MKFLGWISIGLLAAAVGLIQNQKLERLTSADQQLSVEQAVKQEQAAALGLKLLQQSPDLGFRNLVGDWTFLSFLQYFGDSKVRLKTGYSVSPEFFEVIVDRHPRLVTSYLYLSTSMSIYAGKADRAVELMDQGLQSMAPTLPEGSYLVWRYKGIDELLFLGAGEKARLSFEKAVEWGQLSNDPQAPGVVEASQRTAAFLAENPVSKAAQISAWVQVLVAAVDDYTRQLAVARIQALGGEVISSGRGQATVRYRADE